ncbi:MAG: DUF169 domain-containing protein [candidate division Zixibacteria bacterium]|nr:DUF169 domain-containing protein [candidate division Zixibacteria bacterium]MDH3938705.1 DUF169 domain-containing protein [candidate division Zixibacteria bacterium]
MPKVNMDAKTQLDQAISRHVRPDSYPLAVRMVKPGETLPERTKRPRQEFGHPVAVCQTFSIARRYGWQMAVGVEDINCPLALTAFGFKPEVDAFTCGEMCSGMFTESKEAGQRTEADVPKFNFQQYSHILTAPIGRAGFEPDLYLIYGNSAQVMRLLVACLHKDGGYINSRFSGRLDCADICIETINTNKPQVVLPCYGDRVFGQTQDHEMALTIPSGMEQQIVAGLSETHKGGIRFPIPSYLRAEPEYPKHYYRLFEQWGDK